MRPWADIELLKTGYPSGTVSLGDVVQYEIRIANAGPTAGSGAVLSDTIPTGLSVISYTVGNGSCDPLVGASVSCTFWVLWVPVRKPK